MTANFWDILIGCLPPKTRGSVKRVLMAARYAAELHPSQQIGPQLVYDAWLDLHQQAEKEKLDPERNELFKVDASMGTVVQYLDLAIAHHQSSQAQTASSYAGAAADQDPAIQDALDSLKTGIDRIGGLIVAQKSRVEAEQKERFQSILDGQLTAADKNARQAEGDKAAYQQVALERQRLADQIEAMQARLEMAESDLVSTRANITELSTERNLLSVRLDAAQAQIATHQRTEVHCSDELDRLLKEREPLIRDAERGREAKSELERLRRRLDDAEAHKRELTEEIRAVRTREIAAQQKHEETGGLLRQRIAALEDQLTRLFESVAIKQGGK